MPLVVADAFLELLQIVRRWRSRKQALVNIQRGISSGWANYDRPARLVPLEDLASIEAEAPHGEALFRALARHRFRTQLIGMISIFVTATYGMYQNLLVLQGF